MRHSRHTRRATWTLIGAGVLLLAAACGSDDDDDTAGTGESQRSTTTQSTTTTIPAEGPEEWVTVARDLNDRYFDLLQNPDPSKVADVYAETCTCWQRNYDTIKNLADWKEHIEGSPVAVTFVKLQQQDPATQAVDLTVREAMTEPWRRVDQNGAVVQELPPEDPGCSGMTLFPDGPDGAYRIHSQLALAGCPPEAG